jgi:hypothetical protein
MPMINNPMASVHAAVTTAFATAVSLPILNIPSLKGVDVDTERSIRLRCTSGNGYGGRPGVNSSLIDDFAFRSFGWMRLGRDRCMFANHCMILPTFYHRIPNPPSYSAVSCSTRRRSRCLGCTWTRWRFWIVPIVAL